MVVFNRNSFVAVRNSVYLVVTCLSMGLVALDRSQLPQQEVYNYCDEKLALCEVSTDHVMCKYPNSGPSPKCMSTNYEPLTATEKKTILFWHNKFRSNIASGIEKNKKNKKFPTASNMRQIYWDTELEMLATRWADQCTSTNSSEIYDKCRNTKRFQVSQNVGTRQVNATTIDKQAPQIVISWYKESKDFDPDLLDNFIVSQDDEVSTQQFANIIRADTYAIGCARVIFHEWDGKEFNSSLQTVERLVCNYGPGENKMKTALYKKGGPCSNCPLGTKCSRAFPALCAFHNSLKIEGLQILDNQEAKDDGKSEKETATRRIESTSEETTSEDEEDYKVFSSNPPNIEVQPEENSEIKKETEKEKEEEKECTEEKCPAKTPKNTKDSLNRFEEIIKYGRPTARKKSREVGTAAPSQRDGINSEKRKWIVSNGKKVKRNQPEEKKLRNGDRCKCFQELHRTQSDASCTRQNIFLIFFSFTFYFLL